MSLKTCEVSSCKRPAAKGNPFCEHHAERIFRASKSVNEKTSPNWLVDMERLTSEEEVEAYSRIITQMMHVDAASVQAFGEPMHISKAEWDAGAAGGWKTTDVSPGRSRPIHPDDGVEFHDDAEENTSLRDALENVASGFDRGRARLLQNRRTGNPGGRLVMAYDEELAARVREILEEGIAPSERKMVGGIAFMVNGHMCCGVIKEDLVLRLGPDGANKALQDQNVRRMDFTGRPMKGFVFVSSEGTRTETRLRRHLRSALEFVKTLPPK